MIWFLKIGLCLVISSLVLMLLYCLAAPLNYTNKTCKLENLCFCIFGYTFCGGVISCLIWFCSYIMTASFHL
jgi:hypothetical protein